MANFCCAVRSHHHQESGLNSRSDDRIVDHRRGHRCRAGALCHSELLSKEENVSISAVLPMLSNIKRKWLIVEANDSTATKALKRKLLDEINSRWEFSDPTEAAVLGAAIDPRFKALKLSDEEKEQVHLEVAALAEALSPPVVRVRQEEVSDADGDCVDPSDSDDNSPAKRAKMDREKKTREMLLSMDDDDDDEEEARGDGPTAKTELKDFLRDKSKARSGPLSWWKDNAPRYPKLAKVAKRILSIPATSTPAERIFSKAGFIVNKNRSSLLPKNVDTLVFLAHNEPRVGFNSE